MLSVKELMRELPDCVFEGDVNAMIGQPKNFDTANDDETALMWVNAKHAPVLDQLAAGTVICPVMDKSLLKKNINYILSPNPRKTFATLLRTFFVPARNHSISSRASIHETAVLGNNCSVADFAVIQANVTIGDNVVIDNNTVIKENTVIGHNVYIGCNCTIGNVGFGYEKDDLGEYVLIPHIGNVVIKNNVEIGNNTTIDRAVMGSTILEENVKVDNLVHIAHGVRVGKNSLVIANAMVAGSTTIGENVWVAPSASILNKLSIEDDAVIGLGAVVVKNVKKGDVVVGNPARPINKN